MKETMLDVNGQIPDDKAYYRGLISNLGNTSLVRFYHNECQEDKELDKTHEGGPANYISRMLISSFKEMPQFFVVQSKFHF